MALYSSAPYMQQCVTNRGLLRIANFYVCGRSRMSDFVLKPLAYRAQLLRTLTGPPAVAAAEWALIGRCETGARARSTILSLRKAKKGWKSACCFEVEDRPL